ncbi:MAG: HAD family phosphatase [Nanoarchaeota archaeon]|nr:HAD family phosphatase [Nanoarchaeota archaeon]MCA9495952.1 HAD family phosphatase [Nanoarchaeota archaeon]
MIKAVLFDFDNTIIETEESRFFSINEVLREFGLILTREDWNSKYRRENSKPIFQKIFEEAGKQVDYNSLYERSVVLRRRYFNERAISIIPGFGDFFDFLQKRDIKVIIVSGGTREHIEFLLKKTGLYGIKYLGREDYGEVKPSPKCYLKALEKLYVNGSEAVVFDDSYNGMKAGIDAGCRVIGINCEDEIGVDELDLFMRVKDYRDLDYEEVLR